MARDCPHRQRVATSKPTVGDMGCSHRVFTAVDDRQAEHQAIVIEATGIIGGSSISILFDPRATNSFVSPLVVERCRLVAIK